MEAWTEEAHAHGLGDEGPNLKVQVTELGPTEDIQSIEWASRGLSSVLCLVWPAQLGGCILSV